MELSCVDSNQKSIRFDLREQVAQLYSLTDAHQIAIPAVIEALWAILLGYHFGLEIVSFNVSHHISHQISKESRQVDLDQKISVADFVRSFRNSAVVAPGPATTIQSALLTTQLCFSSCPAVPISIDQSVCKDKFVHSSFEVEY